MKYISASSNNVIFATFSDNHSDGLHAGYTIPGLSWLGAPMQPYDPACHKTVICRSVDLPEPHGHIMAACSISCSHTPRRNEPYDCHLISSPHSYTTYKLASQTIQRLLYAVTIRPKSLWRYSCFNRSPRVCWNALASAKYKKTRCWTQGQNGSAFPCSPRMEA